MNNKEYREKHKEELYANRREYYKQNKEYLLRYGKEYRKKNAERLNQCAKDYRKKNDKEIREWREKNKERIKIRKRNYRANKRKTDDVFWMVDNMRIRLRKLLKAYPYIPNLKKTNGYFVEYQKIIEHLQPLPKNLRKYVIHHIIPLGCFDLGDPIQFKLATSPENHKLMLITEHNKINHKELITTILINNPPHTQQWKKTISPTSLSLTRT